MGVILLLLMVKMMMMRRRSMTVAAVVGLGDSPAQQGIGYVREKLLLLMAMSMRRMGR